MAEEFTYINLLLAFIILPMLFTILTNLKIITRYKLVILSSLIILPVIFLWDYLAITNKVWYFVNIMNILVLGLPIEEIIFMISLTIFVASVTLIILKR